MTDIEDRGSPLRAALDTLPAHFAILDDQGAVRWTNRAWREFAAATDAGTRLAGRGENYLAATETAEDPLVARKVSGVGAVLDGERDEFELEYAVGTAEKRWFLMRVTPFAKDGVRYATVVHYDITDRKEREAVWREGYELMTATDRPFDDRIDDLLDAVRGIIGTDYATLSRVRGDEYVFEAVAGDAGGGVEAGLTVPLGELPNCKHVVETERRLVLEDVEAEAPELADPEWGIDSYLGVPVTVGDEVYGTFCFYSTTPRATAFSEWAVTFVSYLGNWVGDELERQEHERKLQQIKENISDIVWMSSPEKDEIEFVSDAYGDVWGVPPATLREDATSFVDAIHPDDRDRVRAALAEQRDHPEEYEETYRVVRPDGEIRWVRDRASGVYADDGTLRHIVGVATDITDRKVRERALERQRDELAQLQRLNTLVRKAIQALQNTATRDAIETAVCEHLTESELYQTVWIGTRDETHSGTPTVNPRTVAGVDEAYVADIPGGENGPARRALRTGEVQIVDDIATASAFPESRRGTALAHGHRALAAVPLTSGETTYGVLVVYAPRNDTIGDAERDILADLGRSIALAIQRVHSRRSLTAETAVRLEFRIPDSAFVFGEVSAEQDCELHLERRVQDDDGTVIYYIDVHDGDPMRVCESLRRAPPVAACRVIREAGQIQPATIEVSLEATPRLPLDVLTDYGGSVIGATAKDGDISVSVELPPSVDIRAVRDDLEAIAPTIDLLSKRHVERPARTIPAVQELVSDQLTPKQGATLQAAYARGYYEWPRDCTVEELAETFDISAPTLHYRLRKAHRTAMTALLDGEAAFEDA